MIKVVINGREISTEKGEPFCRWPATPESTFRRSAIMKPLPPYAACRFCIVEVTYKGATRCRASCIFPVEDGMEIKTHSERVLKIRRVLAELMLARCPESDVIRDLAYDIGVGKCRFDRPRGEKAPCMTCGVCRIREEMRISSPEGIPSTIRRQERLYLVRNVCPACATR